jgi:hypothetical protein
MYRAGHASNVYVQLPDGSLKRSDIYLAQGVKDVLVFEPTTLLVCTPA